MDTWFRTIVIALVILALGVALGRRTAPSCAPYREAHEHGTACIVDTVDDGTQIEYHPEEP